MKSIAMIVALIFGGVVATAADLDVPPMAVATGRILSVDSVGKSLDVRVFERDGTTTDLTFVLDDKTMIVKDGGPIALSALRPDDRIRVDFRVKDEKRLALNIRVESNAS